MINLIAKLLYTLERWNGQQHYRNPLGWGWDVVVPNEEVLKWETKIYSLFCKRGAGYVADNGGPGTDPLLWLRLYAQSDTNNREEDVPAVIGALREYGFLANDGTILSDVVATIVLDTIRPTYKGMQPRFRLLDTRN